MSAMPSPEPAGTGAHRRRLVVMARQVGEERLDRVERLLVGVDDLVGEAGHLGVQRQPPSSSGSTVSPDRERGEQRARHRHDRALAHHAEIGQHGVPGRRAVARARAPPTAHGVSRMRRYCVRVVAEQRAHAARAHVVGHARAGRFAEEDERHAALGRDALHVADLAAVGGADRRAHHGEVVGRRRATSRPSIRPKPAILPSAGDLVASAGLTPRCRTGPTR